VKNLIVKVVEGLAVAAIIALCAIAYNYCGTKVMGQEAFQNFQRKIDRLTGNTIGLRDNLNELNEYDTVKDYHTFYLIAQNHICGDQHVKAFNFLIQAATVAINNNQEISMLGQMEEDEGPEKTKPMWKLAHGHHIWHHVADALKKKNKEILDDALNDLKEEGSIGHGHGPTKRKGIKKHVPDIPLSQFSSIPPKNDQYYLVIDYYRNRNNATRARARAFGEGWHNTSIIESHDTFYISVCNSSDYNKVLAQKTGKKNINPECWIGIGQNGELVNR
jgi:hypothetical protein